MVNAVRAPAVPGTFYPAGPGELAQSVDSLLSSAKARAVGVAPKALIAPHAGYVYSGPVAATAYAMLASLRGSVHRVVLLGPAHRARVSGLALPGVAALRTPLGDVPVDTVAAEELARLSFVTVSPSANAREHSLEVHLPFLQRVLGDFEVVPLAVGDASPPQAAEVLGRVWGGPETLVVISSDLSHYLPYATAKTTDEATAQAIEAGRYVQPDQACGARAVNGLLEVAKAKGLQIDRLDLRTSGDTAGGRDEVVGYGAWAVFEPLRGGRA